MTGSKGEPHLHMETRRMNNEERFDKIDSKLAEHDGTLAEHSETLADHSERLIRIENTQAEHGKKLDRLGEDVSFLVQAFNRTEEQHRRYYEMILEAFRSEIRAFGEGIRHNRERIDDHEVRIDQLEAS